MKIGKYLFYAGKNAGIYYYRASINILEREIHAKISKIIIVV